MDRMAFGQKTDFSLIRANCNSAGRLNGLFHQHGFASAIVPAVRAGLVGQLGFVAVWALGERLPLQAVVGPAPVAASPGMSSFWICHYNASFREAFNGPQFLFAFGKRIRYVAEPRSSVNHLIFE
jgi:hypothetical protein